MKQQRMLIRRLAKHMDPTALPLPGVPIIELTGDRRFLMENHGGVREYSSHRITVGVSYGLVAVEGSGLEICSMTAGCLVICGTIRQITLERGAAQ